MKIILEGAANVRDFAEYGCPGCIRSAHLNGVTERDIEILTREHDLRTVIDLRTTKEREEKPDRAMPGVTLLPIPLFDEAVPGLSHEKQTGAAFAIPDMARLYRALVTEQSSVAQIKKAMAVIGDPARQGAVLWHCTEGKDRCGLISALFLLSQGVDDETVIEDYLKTNEVNAEKAQGYYDRALAQTGNEALAGKIRDAFLAKREYIQPVMDILRSLV